MNYESWKSMLVSKQQLQRMIHTTPSPLEKEILRASVDKLEAKIMCAPEHYWKDYVGEYKKCSWKCKYCDYKRQCKKHAKEEKENEIQN